MATFVGADRLIEVGATVFGQERSAKAGVIARLASRGRHDAVDQLKLKAVAHALESRDRPGLKFDQIVLRPLALTRDEVAAGSAILGLTIGPERRFHVGRPDIDDDAVG